MPRVMSRRDRVGVLLVLLAVAGACHERRGASSQQRRAARGFVLIRAGSFSMGSPEQEAHRYTNEVQHEVTLTHDFELAATEVTQQRFEALMGYRPWRLGACPKCPVESVSWSEAAAYCNALSRREGASACYACEGAGPSVRCQVTAAYAGPKLYDCPGYRLPTDAEWEYAYRAGTSTPYYSGTNEPDARVNCAEIDPFSDQLGWYCANAANRAHPVGQKRANAWGLYDLAGNVWEWCNDGYQAVLSSAQATDPWGDPEAVNRVVRGGAWDYYSRGMRAAARAWYKPSYRGTRHGFRPARSRPDA